MLYGSDGHDNSWPALHLADINLQFKCCRHRNYVGGVMQSYGGRKSNLNLALISVFHIEATVSANSHPQKNWDRDITIAGTDMEMAIPGWMEDGSVQRRMILPLNVPPKNFASRP